MTPVTRRIPDAEKNRFVLRLRFPPDRFPPRHPIHRIVGMLQQVGTHLPSQRIRLLHPHTLAPLLHPRTAPVWATLTPLFTERPNPRLPVDQVNLGMVINYGCVTLIRTNSLPDPVACACIFTKPVGEAPALGLAD